MTQHERELLVEKYLSGDMNAAEESDFFINVALDNNLQQTLRAQRTLHRALASDMLTAVPQQAAYRSNIMALLASTQVIGGAGIGAGAGASSAVSGSSAAGAGAAAGSVATGTVLTKVILGTALGLSLAGGTLYVTGQFDGNNQPATPNVAPVQRQLETLPPQIQPPMVEQPTSSAQQPAAAESTKRSAASKQERVELEQLPPSGDQVAPLPSETSTQLGTVGLQTE